MSLTELERQKQNIRDVRARLYPPPPRQMLAVPERRPPKRTVEAVPDDMVIPWNRLARQRTAFVPPPASIVRWIRPDCPTTRSIVNAVCLSYSVRRNDLLSRRRDTRVCRPRQIAIYLTKQLTRNSLPEIGRQFGGRDHTTILYAVRQVEKLISLDAVFAGQVETIRSAFQQPVQVIQQTGEGA